MSILNHCNTHVSFLFLRFLYFIIIIIIILAVLGLAVHRLSLVGELDLLLFPARASHWGCFPCCRAQAPGSLNPVAVALEVSCSVAQGIFPDLCPPAMADKFLTIGPPGKPIALLFPNSETFLEWIPSPNCIIGKLHFEKL